MHIPQINNVSTSFFLYNILIYSWPWIFENDDYYEMNSSGSSTWIILMANTVV